MTHTDPHVIDDSCWCDCPECVTSEWVPMKFGGARRYCICNHCAKGDCPNWRTDLETWEMIRGPRPPTDEPEVGE